MIALKQYGGVALIVVGALLLGIGFLVGWTSSNLVLLIGLIIIVLGAFLHVRQQKKEEKY
jgi:membrane-bound ClpP family serine protease